MDIRDYIKKAECIRRKELMLIPQLYKAIGISNITWLKMRYTADKCSINSLRKLKKFVDEWEAKNVNMSEKD